MIRTCRLALSAMVAALILPALATAAPLVCGDRDEVLTKLSSSFHEEPVSVALTSDGQLLEVLKSETLTWSILITNPNGVTCLVAAGESWQDKFTAALQPET